MKTFNEWNRLTLSFSEKLTLLQSRLYAISTAYAGLNATSTSYAIGISGLSVNMGSTTPVSPDIADLVTEVDELWSEMKSDVKSAKAAKVSKKTK
jgi:hypothetical protein